MPASSRNAQSTASDSPPPAPDERGRRQRRSRRREYDEPREKRRWEVTIVMCRYQRSRHTWETVPLTFEPQRIDDQELWRQIRDIYQQDLHPPWQRAIGFKKLKYIVPIEFSRNDVPIRKDPKNVPNAHEFKHCFHHPDRIKTRHEWVDWWVEYEKDPNRTYGLEFTEGVWAEKIALLAILINIAVIIVSIIWCIKGGQLQTVFTVMGFVITAAAADIALLALYFQVTTPS